MKKLRLLRSDKEVNFFDKLTLSTTDKEKLISYINRLRGVLKDVSYQTKQELFDIFFLKEIENKSPDVVKDELLKSKIHLVFGNEVIFSELNEWLKKGTTVNTEGGEYNFYKVGADGKITNLDIDLYKVPYKSELDVPENEIDKGTPIYEIIEKAGIDTSYLILEYVYADSDEKDFLKGEKNVFAYKIIKNDKLKTSQENLEDLEKQSNLQTPVEYFNNSYISVIKNKFGDKTMFISQDEYSQEMLFVNSELTKSEFYEISKDGAITRIDIPINELPYQNVIDVPENEFKEKGVSMSSMIKMVNSSSLYIIQKVISDLESKENKDEVVFAYEI